MSCAVSLISRAAASVAERSAILERTLGDRIVVGATMESLGGGKQWGTGGHQVDSAIAGRFDTKSDHPDFPLVFCGLSLLFCRS